MAPVSFYTSPPSAICIICGGQFHYNYLEVRSYHIDIRANMRSKLRFLLSGNAIHCRKKNLSGENENKDIEWENSHIVKAVNPHDNAMTIILEDGK